MKRKPPPLYKDQDQADRDTLCTLIDRHTLAGVLDLLIYICREQATLEGDRIPQRRWSDDARCLSRAWSHIFH